MKAKNIKQAEGVKEHAAGVGESGAGGRYELNGSRHGVRIFAEEGADYGAVLAPSKPQLLMITAPTTNPRAYLRYASAVLPGLRMGMTNALAALPVKSEAEREAELQEIMALYSKRCAELGLSSHDVAANHDGGKQVA